MRTLPKRTGNAIATSINSLQVAKTMMRDASPESHALWRRSYDEAAAALRSLHIPVPDYTGVHDYPVTEITVGP